MPPSLIFLLALTAAGSLKPPNAEDPVTGVFVSTIL
jgi:hypothetical protein